MKAPVMESLFDLRRMWIAAFFKEIFCGTMSSTQRSEGVNATVKGGYVDNTTPIHEFAKQFLEVLQHTHENEARERYNSQVSLKKLLNARMKLLNAPENEEHV